MKPSTRVCLVMFLGLLSGSGYLLAQVPISNTVSGDGAWEVEVDNAGETETASIDPAGSLGPRDVVFEFFIYADAGADGGAVRLSAITTSTISLTGPNQAGSSGIINGTNGVINWTSSAFIPAGSTNLVNTLMFSSALPFGVMRIISYLDEDVPPIEDNCVLIVVSSGGQTDFQLLTFDRVEDFGVSQSARFSTLSGATFVGWAADKFPDLQSAITGSGAGFSPLGNVDTADLPSFFEPRFPADTAYGPADVTSALAFDLDPSATAASVTLILTGASEVLIPSLQGGPGTTPDPGTPQPVPTLSEWGILLTGALLVLFGIRQISRRREWVE